MLLLFKVAPLTLYRCSYSGLDILGHSRKHPYLTHGGNWKLTPLPPLDVLIHLLLSETIFYPLLERPIMLICIYSIIFT
jgi:hypothetical protein